MSVANDSFALRNGLVYCLNFLDISIEIKLQKIHLCSILISLVAINVLRVERVGLSKSKCKGARMEPTPI